MGSIGFPLSRAFGLFLILSSFIFSKANLIPNHGDNRDKAHFIRAHLASLMPSPEELTICKGKNHREGAAATVSVIHRHGPCSAAAHTTTIPPNNTHTLHLDQQRVDSIHTTLRNPAPNSASLPTKSGLSLGSGNYIITLGLGTPKRTLSLVFDTGSDLTWTQCKPCAASCYTQSEPIFDPKNSVTYSNVSCVSPFCNQLVNSRCSSTNGCVYGVFYGDSSYSIGYLGKERLTLTERDYVEGFVFGCGEDNKGLFGGCAGLLGLGRDRVSVVSQAAGKYGRYFSYCLPAGMASYGHLTFGPGGTRASAINYTPLLTSSDHKSFYYIDLQSISIGGRHLSIPPTVFSTTGTIIDSGTVITRLPPKAYSALSSAFKQGMSKYPTAPGLSILDTCFDLSSYQTVSIPKVVLYFRGGATMDLPPSGILFPVKPSQVCLSFAGNGMETSVGIIGNMQHHSFDVVYDVDGGKIGFGPNGC